MATKDSDTKQTLSFYWRCIWKYPKLLIGLVLAVPISVLTNQFLPPLILAGVLNRLSKKDYVLHHAWASFGPELITYALIVLISGTVGWRIVDRLVWTMEGNIDRDISRRVFDHLVKQSMNFHANRFAGSLVSQSNKLVGSYVRMADTTVYQVFPLFLSLIFAAVILAHRAPLFVVALIIFSIFYIISAIFVTRPVRRLSAIQSAAESVQTGYLADVVSNVMNVKSFSRRPFENQEFTKLTNKTRGLLFDMMRGSQKQQSYFSIVVSVISAAAFVLAVISVVDFGASIGTVFLILSYTSNIVGQLFSFSNSALRNYNRSFGDAHDMVAILQLEPEVQDAHEPEKLTTGKGTIEFKDVEFSHDGSSEAIFNDFNLTVEPGEKVGLVGHSGSGKTTFTRLLLRFSDIDGGEILIDGQNIAKIKQDDLRSKVAYVSQEPLLFHRTIAENIAYGKSTVTEKEIKAVAKKASADEFIEKLPKGYETLVGERGVKLSGGQRQRIAIARAMIKDAPILVLDEATSALDSESEKLIQDALWKLMEGRTTIVIAHRLSTIQRMDRIVVLEDGKIAEEGTHKELLENDGIYASLWSHQSGGFLED